MGQIVGGAAKPKRCNLNKLSQLSMPAAGEYILVSSDNSMNAAGQGNFDCYIEGNGRDAATALELKPINDTGVIIAKVNELILSLANTAFINARPDIIHINDTPQIVLPISPIDMGTLPIGQNTLTKSVYVKCINVSNPISITISGSGFSVSTNSISAQDLLDGTTISITYTRTSNSSAQGILNFYSSELNEDISLVATEEQSYITNGLEFFLDGLNKGALAGAWTDRIGGVIFTNNGATSIEKGWSFNGVGGLINENDISLPMTGGNYTMEVVFSSVGADANRAIFHRNRDAYGLGFFYESASKIHITTKTSSNGASFKGDNIVKNNFTGIISYTNNGMYVNGEAISSDGHSYLTYGTANTIGGRYDSSGGSPAWRQVITGEIYAIRWYSRALSAEEIRHNMNVDNTRFGLNLQLD